MHYIERHWERKYVEKAIGLIKDMVRISYYRHPIVNPILNYESAIDGILSTQRSS